MNSFEVEKSYLLPFSFRIIDYKLFINKNYGKSTIAKWDVVTAINGITSTELIYELLPLIPSDGYCTNRKLKLLEKNFGLLYSRKYGFSPSYNLRTISNKKHTQEVNQEIKGIKTDVLIQKKSTRKQAVYFEIDKAKDRAYLKIPSFNKQLIEGSGIVWNKWLKKHFKQLQTDSIHSLVLDLRGNEGGNVVFMSQLMKYLLRDEFQLYKSITVNKQLLNNQLNVLTEREVKSISKKTIITNDTILWNDKFSQHYYFPKKTTYKGNLYVLMDGQTYSSASHAIQLLQHRINTKFYGSETGGNGVSSNAGKTLITSLKNSGFNVHVPLMKGTYSSKKIFSSTSGILPDKYCGDELLMELKYSDICLINVLEEIYRNQQ